MEDGKSAGIGLPAKSRAPALVAGWAPRISQTPGFGARLFYPIQATNQLQAFSAVPNSWVKVAKVNMNVGSYSSSYQFVRTRFKAEDVTHGPGRFPTGETWSLADSPAHLFFPAPSG